ncbi:MAG: DUF2169 domain-containing protein [Pseudomonadota bacterium]
MAYKGIKNNTPYVVEPLLLADEDGRDIMVVLAKATYDLDSRGVLVLAQTQAPLYLAGEHYGDPEKTSLKYAPEGSFAKLGTDVAMIGHAYAPKGRTVTQMDVALQVGKLKKSVRIFGDRVWKKSAGLFADTWKMSAPLPFDKMPLRYERAYGGQDLTPEDKKYHAFEARNLIGVGVVAAHSAKTTEPAPNIEDPNHLIQKITDRPAPAGFGFVAPHWQPRLAYVGTYDEAWQMSRMPLLPKDFNRKYFNAASAGLLASEFLTGTEPVMIVGATPEGRTQFNLPGGKPEMQVSMAGETTVALEVCLDSVVINTDERRVQMLWRAAVPVYQRIYDLEEIVVSGAASSLNKPQAASTLYTKQSTGASAWA